MKGFISYAHKDGLFNEFRKKFEHQLSLDREIRFDTWTDLEIPIGSKWHTEIMNRLHEANYILLLVSDDFSNSSYIQSNEVPEIFRHANEHPCVLAPVLLSKSENFKFEETGMTQNQFFLFNRSLVAYADTPADERDNFIQQLVQQIKAATQHKDFVQKKWIQMLEQRKYSQVFAEALQYTKTSDQRAMLNDFRDRYNQTAAEERLPSKTFRDGLIDFLSQLK